MKGENKESIKIQILGLGGVSSLPLLEVLILKYTEKISRFKQDKESIKKRIQQCNSSTDPLYKQALYGALQSVSHDCQIYSEFIKDLNSLK